MSFRLVQTRTSVVESNPNISSHFCFRLVQIHTSVVDPKGEYWNYFCFRLVQIRTSIVAKNVARCKGKVLD